MNIEPDIYPDDPENQGQESELVRLTRDQIEAKMAKQVLEALPDDPPESPLQKDFREGFDDVAKLEQVQEAYDELGEQLGNLIAWSTFHLGEIVGLKQKMREMATKDPIKKIGELMAIIAMKNTTISAMQERNGNMSNQIAEWASKMNSLCHYITDPNENKDEAKMFAEECFRIVIPFLESDGIGDDGDVDDVQREYNLERAWAHQVTQRGKELTDKDIDARYIDDLMEEEDNA